MRLALLFLATLGLGGCASKPLNFEAIHKGMDKDQVLQSVGDPKRTYRTNGQDHWVYLIFEDGRENRKHVAFEDGRVVRVYQPTLEQALIEELEAKGSLEDYERQLKAKRSHAGFKPVDGGSQEPKKP